MSTELHKKERSVNTQPSPRCLPRAWSFRRACNVQSGQAVLTTHEWKEDMLVGTHQRHCTSWPVFVRHTTELSLLQPVGVAHAGLNVRIDPDITRTTLATALP